MRSTRTPSPFLEAFSTRWSGMDRLQSAYLEVSLLPIEALFPPGEQLFTPRERAKSGRMSPRRQRSFTAARVALKRLVRYLGLVDENRPDRTIETLGPDNIRPCLSDSGLYCSVFHSGPLVPAVAHRHPVGVDLEGVSQNSMRALQLFSLAREQDLISLSPLGPERAATRVWTCKEAAPKALGLHLNNALREVEVVSVGKEEGLIHYQTKAYPVRHGKGDGQVITLIACDDL
jgi:phosphopantetheinyl transferase